MKNPSLMTETLIKVRFNEVDSLGVVWHGHYVRYFEDGREDFGARFGLSYLDFYNHDILVPVVKIDCNYKRSLIYGDSMLIETTFVDCEAAKAIFNYTIYNNSNHEVIATGSTTQVFMNLKRELLLNSPAFFVEWKKQFGLIENSY